MANYKRKGHRGRSKKAPKHTQGAGRCVGNSYKKAISGEWSRSSFTNRNCHHQAATTKNRIHPDDLE
jgi:hypothetical protein